MVLSKPLSKMGFDDSSREDRHQIWLWKYIWRRLFWNYHHKPTWRPLHEEPSSYPTYKTLSHRLRHVKNLLFSVNSLSSLRTLAIRWAPKLDHRCRDHWDRDHTHATASTPKPSCTCSSVLPWVRRWALLEVARSTHEHHRMRHSYYLSPPLSPTTSTTTSTTCTTSRGKSQFVTFYSVTEKSKVFIVDWNYFELVIGFRGFNNWY